MHISNNDVTARKIVTEVNKFFSLKTIEVYIKPLCYLQYFTSFHSYQLCRRVSSLAHCMKPLYV